MYIGEFKKIKTSKGVQNEITIDGETFHVQPELFIIRSVAEIKAAIQTFIKTGSYKGTAVDGFASNIKNQQPAES